LAVRQDFGIAAVATSNAILTAREVAASVEERLEVELESRTAPQDVVVAALIARVGVVPAVIVSGRVGVMEVIAVPLDTAVIRPCKSTVILAVV
jgi:hypothetical protein